jgi:hypothetical protein
MCKKLNINSNNLSSVNQTINENYNLILGASLCLSACAPPQSLNRNGFIMDANVTCNQIVSSNASYIRNYKDGDGKILSVNYLNGSSTIVNGIKFLFLND